MVYNNIDSEEKATANREIMRCEVKCLLEQIRYLPFNLGSATLKVHDPRCGNENRRTDAFAA